MTPKLEFCLLGPVIVRRSGVALPVPRGKQRAVLAVLLLNAGRVVSVGDIAEALWGPASLPSASATVRNYVKRLRRVLGDADQARIVTRSPGYVIRVDPGELDVAGSKSCSRVRAARREDSPGRLRRSRPEMHGPCGAANHWPTSSRRHWRCASTCMLS